jgi:hypothetical protein
MKMEHVIRAPLDGVVEDVFFGEVSLRKGRVEAGAFCMMLVVVIYVEGDVAVAGDVNRYSAGSIMGGGGGRKA